MPRPKGIPNKYDGKPTRELILDAAMTVLCYHGFDATTLTMVARQAGVSRPLVNNYFHSKEQLAAECIRRFLHTFFEVIVAHHQTAVRYVDANRQTRALFIKYRDEWRLLMAVICTPALESLQMQLIPHFLGRTQKLLAGWDGQFIPGTDIDVLGYQVSAIHFAYVSGGNVQNYHTGMECLLAPYLNPGA